MLDRDITGVATVDACRTGGLTEAHRTAARRTAALAHVRRQPFAPHDLLRAGRINRLPARGAEQPDALIMGPVRAFDDGSCPERVTEVARIVDGHVLPGEGAGLGAELRAALSGRVELTVQRTETDQ